MTRQILIVDDDPLMRRSLSVTLDQAGYRTVTASTAEEAVTTIKTNAPDLILLDIGLPGMDGLQAIHEFRRITGNVPVIYLTARRRELDEVVALELGADDYITKPFDLSVLQAHIRAVLRRAAGGQRREEQGTAVVVGDLQIDPVRRTALIAQQPLELSPKEFDLLFVLAQNVERVLSLDELLSQVWGASWVGEQQTLYVHVRWLREKIEADPARPRRLLTVRGVGYKLVNPQTTGAVAPVRLGATAPVMSAALA
ncbi:MAG: DNA-binding response regulator [Caldilinea sp. CFX5]|nr:DNA-binding response regulator [Caldilinea sp. CFX5]